VCECRKAVYFWSCAFERALKELLAAQPDPLAALRAHLAAGGTAA
jgi:hypothetical protein